MSARLREMHFCEIDNTRFTAIVKFAKRVKRSL